MQLSQPGGRTMIRRVIDTKKVASKLGLSVRSVQRLRRRRELPLRIQLSPNRFGYYEDEIDDWLERRRAN